MNSTWTIPAQRLAVRLRRRGVPYAAIAVVVDELHGVQVSADGVRRLCRRSGLPPKYHGTHTHLLRSAA